MSYFNKNSTFDEWMMRTGVLQNSNLKGRTAPHKQWCRFQSPRQWHKYHWWDGSSEPRRYLSMWESFILCGIMVMTQCNSREIRRKWDCSLIMYFNHQHWGKKRCFMMHYYIILNKSYFSVLAKAAFSNLATLLVTLAELSKNGSY